MFKRILLDELDAKKRFYTDKVNSKLKYIREFYNEINLMKTFDSHAPFMNIQHALTSRSEIWKTWKIPKKKDLIFSELSKAAIRQEFESSTNCLPQCKTEGVHQTDTDVIKIN